MLVAGVDGCRAPEGWVALKVEVPSLVTSVRKIDLPSGLRNRPPKLAYLQSTGQRETPEPDAETSSRTIPTLPPNRSEYMRAIGRKRGINRREAKAKDHDQGRTA